tara:strand:+ start:15143 stop:15358 length:216 start_codon:yes stop_codon:yes gene_type:complete
MPELEIYPPGATVLIEGIIEGTINSIVIGCENHVKYEVSWWDGNQRNLSYFSQGDIYQDEEVEKVVIGFTE